MPSPVLTTVLPDAPNPLIAWLAEQPLAVLLLVVTLGMAAGAVRIGGISLGPSGALFVGLVAGHFGLTVPAGISALGVALFVYAVGLQNGPRFFRTVRTQGPAFVLLAGVTMGAGFLATLGVEWLFGFGPALSSGLFAGALTSTPGLAAALDALRDPAVPVGFGIAYPLGLLAVVLFVQVGPRLMKVDLRAEAARLEEQSKAPPLSAEWFEVRNPQLHGRSVGELSHVHFTATTISRVCRDSRSVPARSDTVIEPGDHVRAVGTEQELRRFEMLVGPRRPEFEEPPSDVASVQLVVSEESFAGRTLQELQIRERHGVTITRMWRDDFEFVPSGTTRLEIGDTIRIVGDPEDCRRFVQAAGQRERRLHETPFLPFLSGLLAGVLLGLLPIPLPGGAWITLGAAGGSLLAGLAAGHFGRIGPLSFRVPVAARYFVRELGLILFMAGAGTQAGSGLVALLAEHGVSLLGAALTVTLAALSAAWLTARRLLGLDVLSTLGALCGGMTSTPGLGVVSKAADSEIPALAYAAAYPAALILVTLLAQLLAGVLTGWQPGS